MMLAELKFDPTISISAIVGILSVCITILGAAFWLVNTVKDVKAEQERMNPHIEKIPSIESDLRDVKTDVGEMKPKLDQVVVSVARVDAKNDSHETRLARLEDAIFRKG
jgi:septal ring factor EnvC (AmiA/AmiB activator)